MGKRKYKLRDSPFFRLRTKAKLAKLLRVSPAKLRRLAQMDGGYVQFEIPKKSGGTREINAPILPLKSVQSRIANLLGRIAPPDYLFAPVEGRSYVDNAAHHIGARSVRLLDIEDFFPNCTAAKVVWFFRTRLECSTDVATIIARIATYNGRLPQGSPCSPILAFFAYSDMWEEIQTKVSSNKCKLSVYADDLTISGDTVPEAMIWSVKSILYRHGHKYAVEKERARIDQPAEITGVILTPVGVTVPNRQRQKIQIAYENLKSAKSEIAIRRFDAELQGRLAQVRQVQKGNAKPLKD